MLAYVDSFSGLVPCRIITVDDWKDSSSEARVTFTATRGPYKQGEESTFLLRRVVPRSAIVRRKYSTRILPYSWDSILAEYEKARGLESRSKDQ